MKPPSPCLLCRLTPPGEGGISILQLAGPGAQSILGRLFISPRGTSVAAMDAGKLLYGRIERGGECLDEVVLECVQPPDRYAINCHGGAVAVRRVEQALEAEGALAIPWKQFLREGHDAGALDAIAREAAERLPHAPTLRAFRALLAQQQGALAREMAAIRKLIRCRDLPAAAERIARLLATARYGRGLTDPARLVIAGRPNVGKSTLGNALLRFDRMIVHAQPGTTRDTVEEMLSIRGVPFRLVDTAGLREGADAVEREGVERSRAELARADAVLLVFDASEPLRDEDHRILAGALPGVALPVLNKSDRPRRIDDEPIRRRTGRVPVAVSAATGAGLDELEDTLLAAVYPNPPGPDAPLLFTERQEQRLRSYSRCLSHL